MQTFKGRNRSVWVRKPPLWLSHEYKTFLLPSCYRRPVLRLFQLISHQRDFLMELSHSCNQLPTVIASSRVKTHASATSPASHYLHLGYVLCEYHTVFRLRLYLVCTLLFDKIILHLLANIFLRYLLINESTLPNM